MTTETASKIELRIPARPEFVSVARLAVSAIASRMEFKYDEIEDIKLAVGEACNNAIQHTLDESRPREEVVICCWPAADELIIEVRDQGKGFDPDSVRKVANEETLSERGLGLLLIEALMDEVEFQSSPDSGTQVRMVKHLAR